MAVLAGSPPDRAFQQRWDNSLSDQEISLLQKDILFYIWKQIWFWIVLEKTLEGLYHCKETKPVNPKGNQPWLFIGRTDAQALILWLPVPKSQLIGKDPDAGKDRKQEEKGLTEDEMVGWHRRFNGHELEQALGDGEGQGSLVCYSPWSYKESDTTWRMNNNNNIDVCIY